MTVTSVTGTQQNRVIAIDAGNHAIKVADGGTQRSIHSVQYRLPKGVTPLAHSPLSPVIEVDGVRTHVGANALQYRTQERTVLGDKTKRAALHLYSAVDQSGEVDLVWSHHSPEVVQEELKSQLQGRHSYKRNGKQIELVAKNIHIVPEGLGAYWYAHHSGMLTGDGYTIVVDLGGSTWLYRVINEQGGIVASGVSDKLGSYYLASQIAADDRLKEPLRQRGITSPSATAIMDGFVQGHYYGNTGISWKDWFGEYAQSWLFQIFGVIQSDCTAYFDRTTRILICGGGANLVENSFLGDPLFLIIRPADYANVLGMALHYHQPSTQQNPIAV